MFGLKWKPEKLDTVKVEYPRPFTFRPDTTYLKIVRTDSLYFCGKKILSRKKVVQKICYSSYRYRLANLRDGKFRLEKWEIKKYMNK
jgi:hypothetical protein